MSTSKYVISPSVSIATACAGVFGTIDRRVSCACRDCPDVRMDELKPFSVPLWMVEKMQRAMEAQREVDL